MPNLDLLNPFTVEKPEPLIGAKTIQLILMREVLDYTVLRTEETRELNTVATPLSLKDNAKTIVRVAFLATKQKPPNRGNWSRCCGLQQAKPRWMLLIAI